MKYFIILAAIFSFQATCLKESKVKNANAVETPEPRIIPSENTDSIIVKNILKSADWNGKEDYGILGPAKTVTRTIFKDNLKNVDQDSEGYFRKTTYKYDESSFPISTNQINLSYSYTQKREMSKLKDSIIISTISWRNNGDKKENISTFDKNGYISYEKNLKQNKVRTGKILYEYDDKMNVIKEIKYDTLGNISHVFKYAYNDYGEYISEEMLHKGTKLTNKTVRTFDSNNKLMKDVTYFSDMSINTISEYEYNQKDLLIKKIRRDKDDKLINDVFFAYDQKNNIIRKKLITPDTTIHSEYSYEYDMYNNYTRKNTFTNDKLVELEFIKIDYHN